MKLLCTYEEWLENKDDAKGISEKLARGLELAMKFNKTEEEEKELEELINFNKEENDDRKFTDLTHKITDMCLNPKSSEIDFEQIGRMQFDLERMKYPIVVPKSKTKKITFLLNVQSC